jgi:diacylglycerol kinase (ATP)
VNAGRWVLIAANPKSGSGPAGQLLDSLQQAIIARGFQSEIVCDLQELHLKVDELQRHHQLEAVVSAGGDGTISTLANMLPNNVALLIFPLGTENLLAKYWGLTKDVEHACTTLVGGRTVMMDVGRANGKLFLVMLGCGFDAEVVRQMSLRRKGHIHRWSYTVPILEAIKNYSFPQLPWAAGCGEAQQAAWIFVFNVPRYAAGLDFCPQADPLDGKLDVCTFKQSGRILGMNYLLKLWRGAHQQSPDFQHSLARKITIDAPLDSSGKAIEVPFQLDGDPGGVLPLEVEILPARLKLIVPESTATSDPISEMPIPAASV